MGGTNHGNDELKMRILRAITRPITTMTVEQICAGAKISRQTSYTHFKSKFDIVYWYLSLAEEAYLYEIGRTLSLEEGLDGFFGFLYRERGPLVNAFEKDPKKRELRHRLERPCNEFMWTIQSKGIDVGDDLRFCIVYTVESANCLIASWCLNGMDEPPDVISRRLAMCVPASLVELARLAQR